MHIVVQVMMSQHRGAPKPQIPIENVHFGALLFCTSIDLHIYMILLLIWRRYEQKIRTWHSQVKCCNQDISQIIQFGTRIKQ